MALLTPTWELRDARDVPREDVGDVSPVELRAGIHDVHRRDHATLLTNHRVEDLALLS